MRRVSDITPALIVCCMAMLLATFGCRRSAAPPTPDEPATESPASGEPVPAPPPSANRTARPVAAPTDKDQLPTAPADASLRLPIEQHLTGAIHLYLNDHQKLPTDFATLVREKYLKALPKPPPGKRFALDRNRMQVVILD